MLAARLLALAAVLAPAAALAQPRPGVTTKADVIAAMGEPDMTFQADALVGDVELNLVPGNPNTVDRVMRLSLADPDKRPLGLYDVLQYWDSPTSMETTSFVFVEGSDRLLYAIVKPSPSEYTLDEAVKRYGRQPVVETRTHEMGHIRLGAIHLVFRDEGVELVVDNSEGRVSRKIYVRRDAKGHATTAR